MSYCNCPLKAAAKEAPTSTALIGKDFSLTYRELDALADKPNICEGEIITLSAPPSPNLIAQFFAAWRNNASVCPLNLRYPLSQIDTATKHFQSLLLFTSGSTGTPKIAVLSLKSLLTSAKYSVPLSSEDRWLLSLPLYHVGGIGIMLRCILAKAAIVLDQAHPEITHLSYVPTQLYRGSPVYKNLKCILLGGAPAASIPENLPIYATYGLTEMGSMVLLREKPPLIDGNFYLGSPLPKRELKIAADGEILVRGETLFDGYLGESRSKDAWFATGDIGKLHEKEGIAIVGRKDWQFISGGENIQPEEIEKYLLQIPGVLEAVVLPKKDPEFGARPIAIIRTNNTTVSLDSLQKHLPKYKIPVAIKFLATFPKIGLKIDRRKLKILFDS